MVERPLPRATEPIRPPVLYAIELPPGMLDAWRAAVRELAHEPYERAMREAGLEPDGKPAFIVWLRSDETRRLLAAMRILRRAERDALYQQSLGYWDDAHLHVLDAALADRALRSRLVEAMLEHMPRR